MKDIERDKQIFQLLQDRANSDLSNYLKKVSELSALAMSDNRPDAVPVELVDELERLSTRSTKTGAVLDCEIKCLSTIKKTEAI